MYYTDETSNNGKNALHYHCFHIPMVEEESMTTFELISYCINELSSRFHIQPSGYISNLTFTELSKQNIISEDLYSWFAPVDLIERYQLYLNESSTSIDETMGKEIFYNCTEERFGPMCQYELDKTIIYTDIVKYVIKFYQNTKPFTDNLTCYIHLQCDRGPSPSCLDWAEICDGIFNCLDGPFDEEHCSHIEINNAVYEPVQDEYTVNRQKLILPTLLVEDAKCRKLPLTSSCVSGRQEQLFVAMFSVNDDDDDDTSYNCSLAFRCVLPVLYELSSICNSFCSGDKCREIINDECPPMFNVPIIPVLFGNIYFAYEKNDSIESARIGMQDPYICYNNSLYDDYFADSEMLSFNGRKCYRMDISELSGPLFFFNLEYLQLIYSIFEPYNRYSNINSSESVLIPDKDYPIVHCSSDNQIPSIDYLFPHDGEYIYYLCDNDKNSIQPNKRNILFHYICNRHLELIPKLINGQSETDETECDFWPCNNLHTRCNNFWNCLNGEDEFDCTKSSLLSCSSDEYKCVSVHTKQLICLSINKIEDGEIDCFDAIDEPTVTCINITNLCNNWKNSDIKRICPELSLLSSNEMSTSDHLLFQDKIQPRICKPKIHNEMMLRKRSVNELIRSKNEMHCYRGLPVRIWLDNDQSTSICFCPPSYYGSQCQYQNQRVSLAIKFQAFSDSRQTLFEIIIQLIDDSNERIIHSHVQFTYLFVRDCVTTFYYYLLYSTRPKNQTKTYSIHVDIYEKQSLNYRGSLWFPIINTFLPVHRFDLTIDIPAADFSGEHCSKHQCVHGQCIEYSKTQQDQSFCRCYPEWSGQYCTIPYILNCTCSSDSLCIGIDAHNRSICVCPMYKFGPRCFLKDTKCELNDIKICNNSGQCIPPDLNRQTSQTYTCICSKGLHGDRCEHEENKIHLSFEKNFHMLETILIHLIQTEKAFISKRTTTFRKISSMKESIVMHWSDPSNLILMEDMKKNYYFIDAQDFAYDKVKLTKQVKLSDRCLHISELYNKTIVDYHLLRRIKYYHLPCQTFPSNFSCFYDDVHLCFCYNHEGQRLTNCFQFTHTMKFDCSGENECINGGQCFQIGSKCSKKSTCLCRSCFYGRRCQFITSAFSLSLDNILGYHIQPSNRLINQPNIIKISIGLNIIFTIVGLINGVFTMITFKSEKLREVGCGLYLLGSSITTLIIIILFVLKFWILIAAQMSQISNQLFLKTQCILLDYLLRIFIHMDQWLNACVACERAITVIKGTRFIKKKSKKLAKFIIILLFTFNILTFIHEPFHRHLIDGNDDDDKNEKRIWCVAYYSSNLQIYNLVINTFQLFAPFTINLISAFILVTKKSRRESSAQRKRNFKDILKENYREHKHLFIAPVLLVILALPRLIISYISKCMKSSDDSWLFLAGYFISLIPAMLTFVVFVVPSKFYKNEFHKSIIQYRTTIQRRLHILL